MVLLRGVPGGAFPPYSGGQSGTLLTTHAYVDTQDRPRPRRTRPVLRVFAASAYPRGTRSNLFGEPIPRPATFPVAAAAVKAALTWAGVAFG